jgi:flagellar assembly protein FliH
MPLSKSISKSDAVEKVLDHSPQPFEKRLSKSAEEFLEAKERVVRSFKLSELVASQVGIAEREKSMLDEKAENLALAKVREIQEPAYQQAYELGREEGRKSAFEEASKSILERLASLDELLKSLAAIKADLLTQNEGQLIKAVYHLASRIARFEIQGHDDRILGVLRQAVEHAQSHETVSVKLSKEDFDFLQTIKDFHKRELEFMKKVKLDPQTDIKPGGCIVETNFRTIDATLEERIQNLWTAIEVKIAKPKEKLES